MSGPELECPWPRAPFRRVGFANNHSNSKKQLPSTGTSHRTIEDGATCSFGVPCTMMYSLNFCPRNRGALGNQMVLGRPMGQQSPNIANMCVFLKTSWFLSVLLNGVLHGLAAPQFDTLPGDSIVALFSGKPLVGYTFCHP